MPPVDLVESIQRPRCPSSNPDVGGSLSEIRRAGGWGQLRMVMGYRAWNGPSSADAHSRQAQPRGGGGNDRHASRQDAGRRAGPDACAGTGL